MDYTIFSSGQGCGYIGSSMLDIEPIKRIPISINGNEIKPNQKTTLDNHFSRKLEYLGLKESNEMIFFIGQTEDLFETKFYFQSVFKISENRIFEMFSNKSGRDFLYINGQWK